MEMPPFVQGENTALKINDIHIHLNTYISFHNNKKKKKALGSALTVQAYKASPSPRHVFPSGIVINHQYSWVGMLI